MRGCAWLLAGALLSGGCGPAKLGTAGSEGDASGSGESGTAGETGGAESTGGPGETGPGETGSGDTDPGETGPGDTDPGETGPATEETSTDPGETGPGETGPGDTGGESCMLGDQDGPCRVCAKKACCPQIEACKADMICQCNYLCVRDGGSVDECAAQCGASMQFQDLLDCIAASCADVCEWP